ncbi:MAG: Ig-like domain-containing protein, partial [Clostridia bacterium]|nr:Ig-like domain-containing protein [Clostridia bacterium]
ATCRVYVVGFKAETIKIVNKDTNLTIGQNVLLDVETDPIEAIVESWIYEISDEDVVTVDKNGVIKAEGPGTATIKVKAIVYVEEGKYIEDTITFTVKDGATLFGDSIVTARQEILFSEIGVNASEVEIFDGAEFNTAGNGILLIDDIAIIVVNGKEVSIERCEDGEIVIDNADLFEAKDEGGFVLATDGKLYLSASFADSFEKGNPDVTWSSNRDTIAKVDKNGIVTGVSTGRAVITATTADGKSASVTINVQEVVTVLLIETPKECEESGIARETINGSMVYVDVLSNIADTEYYLPNVGTFNYTKKDNSFEFNFQRPMIPEDANAEEFYSAFDFKVQEYVGEGEDRRLVDSDSGKARFESNKMIFNGEAIDSMTELVVTISAKYPKFASRPEYTTVKFTVKVTKGVAVSSWNDMLAVAEENRVLFNSNKSSEVKTPLWDIVLATDIARAGGHLTDMDLISKLEAIEKKVKDKGIDSLKSSEKEIWLENGESVGLQYLKNMRVFARDTQIQLRGNLYGNGNMIYGF